MSRRKHGDRRKKDRGPRAKTATVKAVAEFYMEVAHSLDLPPKALPVAPPPPPRPTREEAIRAVRGSPVQVAFREWWLPALAVLLLFSTLAYYWWPAADAAVPEDFRGTWITKNSSYAGRMIVLSMETVEIVAGRRAATGPVAVMSSRVDTTAAGIRLRLVYGTTGKEQTLEMTLHPGRPPTLSLQRPANVVWERLEAPSVSAPGEAGQPRP